MGRHIDPDSVHGGLFYDDEVAFARYTAHRTWSANPNTVMEEPALFDALGDVRGARVIDLGCGDAGLSRALFRAGARTYVGIDNSRRMVDEARHTLTGTDSRVELGTIEGFSAAPESADLIISRVAFHYVDRIEPVLCACHDSLTESGRVVFTVVHPVIITHDATVPGQKRTSWVVDEYFVRGARARSWMGGQTVWFHRTVEDYVSALQSAGFRLTRLSECAPTGTLLSEHPDEYVRRSRVPLFLLLAGEKA